MNDVIENIDALPCNDSVWSVERQEELLLTTPEQRGPVKLWHDYPALEVVHFPPQYTPKKFSPPKSVYEGPKLRLEWQDMNNRQPFYHRNADVDEISFQITGDRTLMTELGTVELQVGDFVRIPVAVAHDNYGREDIHLLFYVHESATEEGHLRIEGEVKIPPFEGWESKNMIEATSHCLGSPECDVAISLTEETSLLRKAETVDQKLRVLTHNSPDGEIDWIYKAEHVWIGSTKLVDATGKTYTRHRCADEIQYQHLGTRTLVTQRGVIEMKPGDFVCIPLGCAFTSIVQGESEHISVLVTEEAPRIAEKSRDADPVNFTDVSAARQV